MSTLLQMDDYTSQARTYWWVTTIVGLLALTASIYGLCSLTPATLTVALTGAALAAVTGLMAVTIPMTKTSVSVAEIFVFGMLLAIGPDAAVVAAAAEAACISFRTSKRWTSRLGSPAMAAIAMWLASHLFDWLAGTSAVAGDSALVARLLLLFVVAAVYFGIGTLLVASLIKLKKGEPIRPMTIIAGHAWLGLGYGCSAVVAGLLQASFRGPLEGSVALIAAMLTAALLALLHLYHRRGVPDPS